MGNEVEDILNEIRERVRKDHTPSVAPSAAFSSQNGSEAQPLSLNPTVHERGELEQVNNESMNRLSAYLTTTSRAWDRLPPVSSNRRGGTARFELWLKTKLKSMSRWFTWEQVNFNSAVHHALAETLQALSAYQQELAVLRFELTRQAESSRERFELRDRELTTIRAGIEAQTIELKKELKQENANLSAQHAVIAARSAVIETRVTDMAAEGARQAAEGARQAAEVGREVGELASKIDEARAGLTPRLAELAGEFRESDQQLREEQRVCFKQLSLEASETALNEERGRRLIEARLAQLEKALANGDN